MRLLHVRSLQLQEFFDSQVPEYAILSHTWEKEEVLYSDMTDLDKARAKAGFAKVQGACDLAASQGFDYIWIDTCCIDKSSSAELSEAINSMYRWYEEADVCYAYLCDVENLDQLGSSRWFTRGWTLQELIAPKRVEIYTATWDCLGVKHDARLLLALSQASRVDKSVLAKAVDIRTLSVAKKMYWASARTTTRKEDEAYCLMGLFGVHMPLLYGEGGMAFRRLQQEIMKTTGDQSILAWYWSSIFEGNESPGGAYLSCLAPSPKCFALSGNILRLSRNALAGVPEEITVMGNLARFSAIMTEQESKGTREVILRCQIGPTPGTFPTLIVFRRDKSAQPGDYDRIMAGNLVSQVSLYGSGSILASLGEVPPGWMREIGFLNLSLDPTTSDGVLPVVMRSRGLVFRTGPTGVQEMRFLGMSHIPGPYTGAAQY